MISSRSFGIVLSAAIVMLSAFISMPSVHAFQASSPSSSTRNTIAARTDHRASSSTAFRGWQSSTYNLQQRRRGTDTGSSSMQLRETVTPVEYAYSPLSLDNSLTTVIAFFPTRDAEHQQAFTRAFQSQVMPVLNEEGGFVCSHLFQALDGTKMALYEQWTSYEECIAAYAPTSRSTIVREQTKSVLEIDGKSVDRHVYEVVGWAENLPESENHVIAIDSRLPLVQFDAFATPTEEHQTHLLNLASEILPELMAREGIWSATFHRSSKNPLRVVKIGQWSTEEAATAGALQRAPYWEGVAENENHLYYLVASTQVQ